MIGPAWASNPDSPITDHRRSPQPGSAYRDATDSATEAGSNQRLHLLNKLKHAGLSEKGLTDIFQATVVVLYCVSRMLCLASLHVSMVNYLSHTLVASIYYFVRYTDVMRT